MSDEGKPQDSTDPRHAVWVDASREGFYDPSGGGQSLAGIHTGEHEDPGISHPKTDGAIVDPRCLRLHVLPQPMVGTDIPDKRLSFQIVNDSQGPQADPGPGEAPYGQPEAHTSGNRSTREADLYGRTALPGSMRRIVDSEDGRYALALTMNWVPIQKLAGEDTLSSEGDGTRVRGSSDSKTPEEKILGKGAESVAVLDVLPDQPDASVAAKLWLRRNRPQGYVVDDLGNLGSLASLVAIGRDKTILFRGREGSAGTFLGIRNDAHFVSATGKDGPLCIDYRDARLVTDNGGPVVISGTNDLDPNPPGPGPIKGRLHWDSSKAGRRVNEHPDGPLSPLSFPGGELVPLIYVTADGVAAPDVDQTLQPKGGGKPPKGKGNQGKGSKGNKGNKGEVVVVEKVKGPTAYIGAPWYQIIEVPGDQKKRDDGGIGLLPLPPIDIFGGGGTPGDGGTGFVGSGGQQGGNGGGAGGTASAGGTGMMQSSGASQERDEQGPGTPCPNSASALISSGVGAVGGGLSSGVGSVGGGLSFEAGPTGSGARDPLLEQFRLLPNGQYEQVNTVQGAGGAVIAPGHPAVIVQGNTAQVGGGTGATINLVPGAQAFAASAAKMQVPFFGQPGSGSSVADQINLMNLVQRSIQAVVLGAFGGPGFLASNMAVVHKNTPGNPPAANVIGHNYTAEAGQELAINQPALRVTSTITAPEGASATAEGPGCAEIIRKIEGQVQDKRPLVALDNGDGDGDLFQSSDMGFRVSADNELSAAQTHVLIDQAKPQPEFPIAIGYLNPNTGAMLGAPTYAVRQDGATVIQDLSTAPDPPGTGTVLLYSKNGAVYQQTEDGTETALGGGGGLTSPVGIADGGTGATTAAGARTALGLAIGSDVQAYSANLTGWAGVGITDKQLVYGNGTTPTGASLTTALDYILSSSGEGPLIRTTASGWNAPGSPGAGAYTGSNSSGVMGMQRVLNLSQDPGGAAPTANILKSSDSSNSSSHVLRLDSVPHTTATTGFIVGYEHYVGGALTDQTTIRNDGASGYDKRVVYQGGDKMLWDASANKMQIENAFTVKESAAPSTPAAGYGTFYVDSTTSIPSFKNDSGTVYTMSIKGSDPGAPSGFADSTAQTYVNSLYALLGTAGIY